MAILGLVLGVITLIVLFFMGFASIPVTIVGSLVLGVFNGFGIWETLSEFYVPGFVDAVRNNFLVLAFSCLFAKTLERSGCARVIGTKVVQWVGRQRVLLICIIVPAILTLSGMTTYSCIFAVGPIMFTLFAEADLDRRLLPGIYTFATCTFSMTMLPGAARAGNLAPTYYLGTTLTAAPVLAIVCFIITFIVGWRYFEFYAKKYKTQGRHWEWPTNVNKADYEMTENAEGPTTFGAFFPMVFLIVFCMVASLFFSSYFASSAEIGVIGFLISTVLVVVLNYQFVKKTGMKELLDDGFFTVYSALNGLCSVCGFGAVLIASPAYVQLIDGIMGINLGVYMNAALATAMVAGITGSSASSTTIIMSNMTEYFVSSGANLDIVHRLGVMAGGTLDTLPHASANPLILGRFQTTMKDAYWHIFTASTILPLIVTIIAAVVCTAIGL